MVRVQIRFELGDIKEEALSYVDERWILRVDKVAGFNLFEGLAEVFDA